MPSSTTIAELAARSGVRFGTSGARGLVTALTDEVCFAYATAFAQRVEALEPRGPRLFLLGGDRRASTPRIAEAIATALTAADHQVQWCGLLPTPALALQGFTLGAPSIMVTGSHIPEDRNGIKFYLPDREVLKEDEMAIAKTAIDASGRFDEGGTLLERAALGEVDPSAAAKYGDRYEDAFGPEALRGLRVGVYGHSAVGRDLLDEVLSRLGASVSRLGDSERFISVDTEAIATRDVELARQWSEAHGLDAIVSTDGDSDRPMIADQHGRWCRGDSIAMLCARELGIETVVTPVSSNSAVERTGWFSNVDRTRIGSPYVIEAMQERRAAGERVAGYEANGGFLLGVDVAGPRAALRRLPTRDAFIVIVALLAACVRDNSDVATLVAALPERFTASARLQHIDRVRVGEHIAALADNPTPMQDIESTLGDVGDVNTTDGVRVSFRNEDIIHFRPSGNAPELRCYSESSSPERAEALCRRALAWAKTWA